MREVMFEIFFVRVIMKVVAGDPVETDKIKAQQQQKDTEKEPMLNVGEKILWKNVIKRGFWHRHVEWIHEVTTQGIIIEDVVNGHITRLPYSELRDVVVTNQHTTGTVTITRCVLVRIIVPWLIIGS
jgi:hypothetical protein